MGIPEYNSIAPSLSDGHTCLPQCDTAGRLLTSMDRGPVAPARNGAAVTPHNTNANVWTSLYIGGGGDVCVDFADSGTSVTFVSVPTGQILPVSVIRVKSTGTTATNIVGMR